MRELKRIVADGVIGDVLHVEGHFSNEHSTRVKGGWRDDPARVAGRRHDRRRAASDRRFRQSRRADRVGGCQAVLAQAAARSARRAAALLQFESGATGLLATVRAAPMYWRIHVFGTKGSVESRDETTLTLSLIGEKPDVRTYAAGRFACGIAGGLCRKHRNRQAVSGHHRRHARCRWRVRGDYPLDRRRQAGEGGEPSS